MSDGKKTYNKVTKTEYKTKDYVRRALNNYHKKRVEQDPEYQEKLKEDRKKYKEQNKRKYLNRKARKEAQVQEPV